MYRCITYRGSPIPSAHLSLYCSIIRRFQQGLTWLEELHCCCTLLKSHPYLCLCSSRRCSQKTPIQASVLLNSSFWGSHSSRGALPQRQVFGTEEMLCHHPGKAALRNMPRPFLSSTPINSGNGTEKRRQTEYSTAYCPALVPSVPSKPQPHCLMHAVKPSL